MAKWFQILRTGKFKDDQGREHTFAENDLAEIEQKFNAGNNSRKAPIVIGHPAASTPAWGWINKLKKFGENLYAQPRDLVAAFVDAVRNKQYQEVSISIYPDKTLRHVGFLGGAQPAVPGMESVCFSDGDKSYTIQFSESEIPCNFVDENWFAWRLRSIGQIIGRMRDWLIEKEGTEAADKIITTWDLDNLKEEPPAPQAAEVVEPAKFTEQITSPKTGDEEDKTMSETVKADAVKTAADFSELAVKAAGLETENVRLKAELDKRDREKIAGEASSFVEGLKKEGKILPQEAMGITNILVDLKSRSLEINFSETAKGPADAALEKFLTGLPRRVPLAPVAGAAADAAANDASDFAEIPGAVVDADRMDKYRQAKALAAKEKIPLPDAIHRVMTRKGGA